MHYTETQRLEIAAVPAAYAFHDHPRSCSNAVSRTWHFYYFFLSGNINLENVTAQGSIDVKSDGYSQQ